jgi:hypothetical protein
MITQLSKYGLLAIACCMMAIVASACGSQPVPMSTPRAASGSQPASTPTPRAASGEFKREAENPDQSSVGQLIRRSNASGGQVHGQIGCTSDSPWSARSGYVKYTNLQTPQTDHLYLVLRYSKNSPSSVPVDIYVDEETQPRASFRPDDQGDWNSFALSGEIDLGSVTEGSHSITLKVEGQQYGVLDLDYLILRKH